MAEIKLNKTELKIQKNLLAQLTKYLPTLQLKKQQLQAEVDRITAAKEALDRELNEKHEKLKKWAVLFSQKLTFNLFEALQIEKVETESENIAGVDIPKFKSIKFKEFKRLYYARPVWLDKGIEELKNLISLREQRTVAYKRISLLEEELRQTTIKVNLFEKRLVPQCKENIRRIKIFLGDQEIAAICNAKIAKDKLNAKKQAEAV